MKCSIKKCLSRVWIVQVEEFHENSISTCNCSSTLFTQALSHSLTLSFNGHPNLHNGHWEKDHAKCKVAMSQVWSMAIIWHNWHSGEILSHLFARPNNGFVPATCILKKQQRVEPMFYVPVASWFRGEIDAKKLRMNGGISDCEKCCSSKNSQSLVVYPFQQYPTKNWLSTHSSNMPQKTGCAPIPVKTTKIGCVPVPVKTHKNWLYPFQQKPQKPGCVHVPAKTTKTGCVPVPAKTEKVNHHKNEWVQSDNLI